jgi:hypothetical protein
MFDDQDHLAVIGAAAAAAQRGLLNPAARALGIPQVPAWLKTAHTQGVSTPDEELDFLPLTSDDFTNGTMAPVDHEAELNALPQRPFRGERLILQALYVAAGGATLDGLFHVVISPALYIGAVQVGATQGRMPASAFGPQAFGVRLSMPVAGQGTRIYLPFIALGIGPGDRIFVSGGIFGRAVR